MNRRIATCVLAALFAAPTFVSADKAPPASAAAIPDKPDKLVYPPLAYSAPDRTKFRHVLGNGVPAYVVEDHALPLVDVTITTRAGSWLDAKGQEGLAGLTCELMRDGGAGDRDASAFDEEVAFLAVNLGVGSGDRESNASMNVLKKDLEAALDMLFDVLRRPRFQQDRLDLAKTQSGQDLERRNDDTPGIEMREWRRLMYGADHFESRQMTSTSLAGITRDQLVKQAAYMWNPGNLVIAVSGDVTAAEILPKLEKRMEGWAKGEALPPVSKPAMNPPTGVFVVNKPDVNQTRVSIGQFGVTWDDPDAQALEVANDILGGGGFTSRLMKSVRANEGLAYSAGSGMGFGREYPKTFRAAFQSKNKSVARAVDITLAEIDRLRAAPVTDEELATAKSSFIEGFPQRFNSAKAKTTVFVNDEIISRPPDYWIKYRDRIKAVTKEEVQRVAQAHLHPDKLTILVVGKLDEVVKGDPDHPENVLSKHAPNGLMEIPLPDPKTLVYPNEPKLVGTTPNG